MKWQGSGVIDGQGFMWWQREYVGKNTHGRPYMQTMEKARNIEFTGITWRNSPNQHLNINNADNIYYHDFEIFVDMWG